MVLYRPEVDYNGAPSSFLPPCLLRVPQQTMWPSGGIVDRHKEKEGGGGEGEQRRSTPGLQGARPWICILSDSVAPILTLPYEQHKSVPKFRKVHADDVAPAAAFETQSTRCSGSVYRFIGV